MLRFTALTTLLALSFSAQADEATLRVNQIQVIGTHNSYHAGFQPSATILMKKYAPDSSPASTTATRR